MDTLRRLHTLKLSHNQLIGCQGLGATPTIQMIDMSHNHLQHVDDIEKLCLLLSLNVSSNNLLNVRLYIAYHSILIISYHIIIWIANTINFYWSEKPTLFFTYC